MTLLSFPFFRFGDLRSVVWLLVFVAICGHAMRADDRPNIVLIMADDMGYSDIGCYGGEIPTPNLDTLAESGVRFKQFYNTGRCCPTRASLMTGLYSHESGVGHMVYANKGDGYLGHINQQCVTIAEVLKEAGYQTMMTGKWHVGHNKPQWPSQRGFDRFYGVHIHVDSYFKVLPGCPVYYNDQLVIDPTGDPKNELHPDQSWYTTDVFTDWSLKFLDEAKANDKPFFLYTAYNSPHWPLEAPDENIANFVDKYSDGWDQLRGEKLTRMKELELVSDRTTLTPSECPAWNSLPVAQRRELAFRRQIYAAQVQRMDQNIGRIVEKLKSLEMLENTLILFLSDNGCCAEGGMFGYQANKNLKDNFQAWRKSSGRSDSMGEAWSNASNTPFRLHKKWVHEGGISTPLIAHWPSETTQKGVLTNQVGHVLDVMATCCDVAGAEYPSQYAGNEIKPTRGMSLLPAIRNPSVESPRTLFWEHEAHSAVRVGDWKLVTLNAHDPSNWELYDMSDLRTEMDDLAGKMPEKVEELRSLWLDWAKAADVLPWPKDRPQRK